MISWMQKHNKYLVWTIWIATIAFIGAGFVGWGSYSFGSKAGNVAKVGNIEIERSKFNMMYSNVYGQYNQMLKGTLDKKKAKEMGLAKQAFSIIATQAKILNFAQDMGIVVSNDELVQKIETTKAFQENDKFSKKLYNAYLQSQHLKAKDLESTFKEELIIAKTLNLLETKTLPLETEALSAAMNVSDKIAYKVLTASNINYVSNEAKVKTFWEAQKDNYTTKKQYNLSLVRTESEQTSVTDKELKDYFEENSFNYTDSQGKQLNFEQAKNNVIKNLKLKKTKKSAQKAYIAFKKGEIKSSESTTLPLGDLMLTPAIWKEIENKSIGDILKPKIVNSQYLTIKINGIIQSRVMSYEEAKKRVTIEYDLQAKKEALYSLAESTLSHINDANLTVSNFLTLANRSDIKSLNPKESLQFLQKLFTSNKEKGIISVSDKMVVYNIIEQKFLPEDENKTNSEKQTITEIKKKTFKSNFIKVLDKKYPTEAYTGGLVN